jgi:hypothetical protein
MTSLTKYFEKTGYKAKYHLGDRVSGEWNSVPFIGTVAIDELVSLEEGPFVRIFLDLPIVYNGEIYNTIKIDLNCIKKLV